ncbi:MAG: hypothetical protein DMG65_13795 [Candidatus Angelobacter sp. Gp1-AA117]|nr:MAG: hypothetical protein DMG65_13795 [Candidatus Angelobacter sp. Gp1-AA117]
MNPEMKRPFLVKRERSAAGQCPGCYSFNYPEHLPATRKSLQQENWQVNCALCGCQYLIPQPTSQAA